MKAKVAYKCKRVKCLRHCLNSLYLPYSIMMNRYLFSLLFIIFYPLTSQNSFENATILVSITERIISLT